MKDIAQISIMSTWPEEKQFPEFQNTEEESYMGLDRIWETLNLKCYRLFKYKYLCTILNSKTRKNWDNKINFIKSQKYNLKS